MPHRKPDPVKISVGPQHPALKEPESFTLTLTFEHYGEVSIEVVVRDPDAEGMGGMNMGGG